MIIKLLSEQIPTFWEAIKFATREANEYDESELPAVFNQLLHQLLSDKAQCFVILSEEKILRGVVLTMIAFDMINNKKYLNIETLYMFEKAKSEEFLDTYSLCKRYAQAEKCVSFRFKSRNPKVWEIATRFGFIEKYRTYESKI